VRKITKLNSPDVDNFMLHYRPSYETLITLNDLELGYYIQQCHIIYKNLMHIKKSAAKHNE
jgi:hypothetical protein